ncbi:hypothetical protein HDU92_004522 [Lobulomyces angularis]|nr:hypothetical protein HDU92_004522 [Lobulomyces angularis]
MYSNISIMNMTPEHIIPENHMIVAMSEVDPAGVRNGTLFKCSILSLSISLLTSSTIILSCIYFNF